MSGTTGTFLIRNYFHLRVLLSCKSKHHDFIENARQKFSDPVNIKAKATFIKSQLISAKSLMSYDNEL